MPKAPAELREGVHVGDIGTALEVLVREYDFTTETYSVVDISTATTMQIKLQKPNGTVVTKTGVFSTDGTDGKMRYVTISGDLDEAGFWRIQGYVETASWQGYTSLGEFEVHANL